MLSKRLVISPYRLMQRILCLICLLAMSLVSSAQVVTGSWYGRADVEVAGMHNNYLTELVLRQKGTKVDGIFGYYFRDKYQSIFVHGTYNPRTREVTILNIPVIYYGSNSTVNSIDCNTDFRGVLINSKLGSTLKGTFYHDGKYKYMCPDLKVSYDLDRDDHQQDSLSKAVAVNNHIWKPQPDDYVVDAAAPVATIPAESKSSSQQDSVKTVAASVSADSPKVASTPARDTAVTTMAMNVRPDSAVASSTRPSPTSPSDKKPVADSAVATTMPAPVTVLPTAPVDSNKPTSVIDTAATTAAVTPPHPDSTKLRLEDSKKIAESFVRRKAVLNKEFEVESDSVRLSFYDNGEIDGDSISVFVNKKVIFTHQELAAKAFNVYLHLDSTLDVNEISMFAENLGRLPPNTALMVVTDGKNRYEVFMSSSLTENATIRLRRKRLE